MINKKAKLLINRFGSRDPEIIAAGLGVKLEYRPYTLDTKGYLLSFKDIKIIVVNSNFSTNTQKIIIAHELGHAVLHNKKACFMADKDFFPTMSRSEIEANKFAAELLIGAKGEEGDIKNFVEGVDTEILKELIFYKSIRLNEEFFHLSKFYNNARGLEN